MIFEAPEVNFVDGGKNKQDSQTGAGTDWRDQLNKLLPITLDEVRVVNGRIAFHNFSSTPKVDIDASEVNASLYNLTNVADDSGERVARFEGGRNCSATRRWRWRHASTRSRTSRISSCACAPATSTCPGSTTSPAPTAVRLQGRQRRPGDRGRADNAQLSGYIAAAAQRRCLRLGQDVENDDKGFLRSCGRSWSAAARRC